MRLVGIVLVRAGFLMIGAALLGGLGLAVYAVATGVDGILAGDIIGEKAALKHLIIYPIGAGAAGSILAVPGLLVSYLGGRTLERQRGESVRSV